VLWAAAVVVSVLTIVLRRTWQWWLPGVGFLILAVGWLVTIRDVVGCLGGNATGPAGTLAIGGLLSLVIGAVSRSNELERRRKPPAVEFPRATVVKGADRT
jgi:hypothetical protein